MKKLLSLLLVLSFIVVPCFADNDFKDIKNHWAEKHIEKIADLKIVKGYSDNTFKPQRPVTKCESVLMMYRMLDNKGIIDKSKEELYKNRYKEIMDEGAIPHWEGLREAIAYFVENDVIPKKDLKNFIHINSKNGNEEQVEIARERLCFYLAKTLNLLMKEEVNGIIEVSFKDFDKIYKTYQPYVDLLYKKGIVSGDTNNMFNPKNSITRAEFCKLMVESIRVLDENKITETKKVKVSIKTKMDSLNRVIFYELDDKSKSHIEIVDDKIEVLVGDEKTGFTKATYDDLVVDMIAELTYENDKLIKVEANKYVEVEMLEKTGIITEINKNGRFLYYRDSKSKELTFLEIPGGTKVLLNGKESSFDKGKADQFIIVRYKLGELREVEYKSKTESFQGTIAKIEIGEKPKLSLQIGEEVKEFNFAKEYEVLRNDKVSNISDLKVNDRVLISTEYEEVVKVDATAEGKIVSGRLNSISQSTKNMIKIDLEDGSSKEFEIPKTLLVKVDGRIVPSVFDLKINYYVKLKFDGDDLVEIKATSKENKLGYVGYIEKVHKDVKVIIAETDHSYYSISVKKDTIILDKNGKVLPFEALFKGNKIFFYGVKEETYLNATNILILE